MAGNKFNRYLWLINLIRTEGPIPFRKISERWKYSSYNDEPGKALPLKTFHNHCGVIAELFGVEVECEKGGSYGYFIEEPAESERWKAELLDYMLMGASLKDDPEIACRVENFDKINRNYVLFFLEQIKRRSLLSFKKSLPSYTLDEYLEKEGIDRKEYAKRLGEGSNLRQREPIAFEYFCPIAIFQIAFEWWVVGVFIIPGEPKEKRRISPFCIKYLSDIEVMSDAPAEDLPKHFSVKEYLESFEKIKHVDDFPDSSKRLEKAIIWQKHTRLGLIWVPFFPKEWKHLPH